MCIERRDPELSRRRFLLRAGAGLTLAAAGHFVPGFSWIPRASADPTPGGPDNDHFFLLLRTFGGMDATLGLDPQLMPVGADAQDLFLEYTPDQIIEAEGLRLGPAAAALRAHAAGCAVVNGVMMRRDAGHPALNLYMATGRGDGSGASIPVELASCLGSGPYGVVFQESVHTGARSAVLSSTGDILNGSDDASLADLIVGNLPPSAGPDSPFRQAEETVANGKEVSIRLAQALLDFRLGGTELTEMHVMAAAFKSGAALQGQLEITPRTGSLDTHAGHPGTHLATQTKVWEKVAALFALFKSVPHGTGSLFDRTTFMVFSEFSRTPALNVSQGKDHNPFTNSVLLAGAGINGGKVYGASKLITRRQTADGMPLHIACPFDFARGQIATSPVGASFFYPETVVRSVSEIFGNPAGFSTVDASTPVIPGLVRR